MGSLYSVSSSTGDITTAGSIKSTSTTSGFQPPSMTTTQRLAIPTPADGLIVYDTTLHELFEYQNGSWVAIVSGITQLTGDVTAGPGSGSQATTLATVNGNVGSFTYSNITVNAKGLITAASSGTAPVTSVTGTANEITSSGGTTPTLSIPSTFIAPGSIAATTTLSGTSETLTATTNQVTLGTTNTTTITSPAPVASRTYTIPDTGTTSNFILSGWNQIINADIANAVFSNITGVGAQSQDLDLNTHQIHNVVDPSSPQDAATASYVDSGAHTVAGATTQIQFNSSGIFAGDSNLTWDGSQVSIGGVVTIGTNQQLNGVISMAAGSDDFALSAFAGKKILLEAGDDNSKGLTVNPDGSLDVNVSPIVNISTLLGSGDVTIKPGSDSITSFRVQSAGGGDIITVDSTNNAIFFFPGSDSVGSYDTSGVFTSIAVGPRIPGLHLLSDAGSALNSYNIDGSVWFSSITQNTDNSTHIIADPSGTPHDWSFGATGTLTTPGPIDLSSNLINNVTDPVSAQDAATKNYVDTFITPTASAASVGGAATEELTVSGLLTTSTIYAVSPITGGANNVAITGYVNDTNGSLNVSWTGDPGAGASVLVLFKP